MRIVIADDHSLVRAGIRALLEHLQGVEVVGEASDGRNAARLAASLQPDVVLMDIAMPEQTGLEAAAHIKAASPNVKVIILSMHVTEEYVMEALRAGASGYLVKDCATVDLEAALRSVVNGEIYLSPTVSQIVVDGYMARTAAVAATTPTRLTSRQAEILRAIAEGKSTKQIALEAGCSGSSPVRSSAGIHAAIHHTKPDGQPRPESECLIALANQSGEPSTNLDDHFCTKTGELLAVETRCSPIL